MTKLYIALLTCSLAFATNTWSQSSTTDPKQTPTIEDRIGQLEQGQQDLTGQVDALNKKIASLEKEVRQFERKAGGSSEHTSQAAPVGPDDAAADRSTDDTNGTQAASYDVFYDRLQSDGQWFNDETYGNVWQPDTASNDQYWRPYTDGRWVYTDRGWTWVSNEKFGWATYHYGRWARLNGKGWVWIPGDKWAPAWVSWRESDDYVGWAPLPPEAEADQDVKIEGWADNYYDIGPTAYVFLRTTDLGNENYRNFIASPGDNIDFISRTKNVTNIYDGRDGVIDSGPDYDQLIQRSKVKIDKYRLNFVQQNGPQTQFGATAHGDQLQVLAPSRRLQRAATVEPKIARNIANAQVDRGWQNIDAATADQLRQTWEKQTPVPATLPQKPQAPKPVVASAGARQGEQSRAENDGQNKPSTITQPPARSQTSAAAPPAPTPRQNEKADESGQQPPAAENRRQEPNQRQRTETTPPAPTPRHNETADESGQQPPAAENRRQEPNQRKRVETTPPAPSPSQNAVQRPERESTSANQNQRQESRDLEKTQATPKRPEPPEPKGGRPDQSDGKPARGGNSEQAPDVAGGTNEKRVEKAPQKEENAARQQRTREELSSGEEGRRKEGDQSPRKSSPNEARQLNEEKKAEGRGQSGDTNPNNRKRPEEPEKQKVEPSVPQ